MRKLPLLAALVLLSACQPASESGQTGQSVSAIEGTLGGPDNSSGGILGWAKDEIVDIIGTFSATNGATYYPTPTAAYEEIAAQLNAGGIASMNQAVFVTQVGKVRIAVFDWDHSEFRIRGAFSLVDGHFVPLDLRTVGDPWGAGMFSGHITDPLGPFLCLPWDVLQAAIAAAYRPGVYGADYVCHTDTRGVLETIRVAPEYYEPLMGGWKLARWAYGPIQSSGLNINPATWPPVQACAQFSNALSGAE